MQTRPTPGRLYQHTIKGGEYIIHGIALDTERQTRKVVYQQTHGERLMFVRPLDTVDKDRPEDKAWMEPNPDGSPRFKPAP